MWTRITKYTATKPNPDSLHLIFVTSIQNISVLVFLVVSFEQVSPQNCVGKLFPIFKK